jgi:hypothetical protein
MLLDSRGLLVLTPVVALAGAGVVLLWRRSLRAEAAVVAGLTLAELAWHAFRPTYELALGGWVPGPRFLVPLLPLHCFALAPVVRRAPLTTAALGAISIVAMTVATSAEPLLPNDDVGHWFSRIADGNFAATVLSATGIGHGWLAILPLFLFVVVAFAAAAPVGSHDARTAAAAVAAWLVLAAAAPDLLRVDDLVRESWGAVASLLLLEASSWFALRRSVVGLALLAPFLFDAFVRHTAWAALYAAAVPVALTTRSALARLRASRA